MGAALDKMLDGSKVAVISNILLLGILASCATTDDALRGEYHIRGGTRPATLELMSGLKYRFCYRRCSEGTYSVRVIDSSGGRVLFSGRDLEEYVQLIKIDSYGERGRNTNQQGSVELSYQISGGLPEVLIDAGSNVSFIR